MNMLKELSVARWLIAAVMACSGLTAPSGSGNAATQATGLVSPKAIDVESSGILERKRRSFYRPGEGTIEADGTPESFLLPRTTGEGGEALAISSDIGRYVLVLNPAGDVRCHFNTWPNWGPSGILTLDDEIWFGLGKEVVVMSSKDCSITRRFSIPGAHSIIFISKAAKGFLLGFEGTSAPDNHEDKPPSSEVVLWSPEKGIFWRNPFETASPRSAIENGVFIIIADTFWHRIFAVDMRTSRMVWSMASYYPNELALVNESEILVAEEHLNRIARINTLNQTRSVVFGCNLPLFQNHQSVFPGIVLKEKMSIDPIDNPLQLSACAIERSGRYTLYSPNAVFIATSGYYIADTDNHRVIKIDANGLITREITNLNNPVSVHVLP